MGNTLTEYKQIETTDTNRNHRSLTMGQLHHYKFGMRERANLKRTIKLRKNFLKKETCQFIIPYLDSQGCKE